MHWHVAALPPGVPFDEQPLRTLMTETKGVLALTTDNEADLADRPRDAMEAAP